MKKIISPEREAFERICQIRYMRQPQVIVLIRHVGFRVGRNKAEKAEINNIVIYAVPGANKVGISYTSIRPAGSL